MAFQEQVGRYRAQGVAGQAATPDQSVYTVKNYLSDGTVRVGTFAFVSAEAADKATANNASAASVLGLVERVIQYPIYQVDQSALTAIPDGCALTIAVRGDYYVETTAAATVGDAVFASTTDGTIKTAAAGSMQGGYVETPWRVKDALEATEAAGLILISNWGTEAPAAGTGGSTVNFDLGQATGVLDVAKGGTGSTTAEAARTALGLGTLATKNSPLPVADGGTGATDAANAKTNLEIS